MLPRTLHNLDPMACVSAMQKYIRRGMEREAMEVAAELVCTSKAFCTMVCNRLMIISHEDIGLANPAVAPFVYAAVQTARELYDKEKPGKALLGLGNAIRMMARSPKSREGDHFCVAVGIGVKLGKVPQIPDWCFDVHTRRGRQLGRGIDHFFAESAKLDNDVTGGNDSYKAEAREVLRRRLEGDDEEAA